MQELFLGKENVSSWGRVGLYVGVISLTRKEGKGGRNDTLGGCSVSVSASCSGTTGVISSVVIEISHVTVT